VPEWLYRGLTDSNEADLFLRLNTATNKPIKTKIRSKVGSGNSGVANSGVESVEISIFVSASVSAENALIM